jgi:hypothetical protein
VNQPSPPDPTFPRLSAHEFPAYRYVPGRTPHPYADPEGHSYGRKQADFTSEALVVRDDWRASPSFCRSVDLYNYAYWWEAHEGWEGLWRCFGPDDPLRYALQVFIQISAAHLQRFMGREEGVRTLLKHARQHLDVARGAGEVVLGCNLEAWWSESVKPYFANSKGAPYPFLRPE